MLSKECEHDMENLLYNIVYLRKKHGLTKKKMAEFLNVGVWSIDKIEKGVLPKKLSHNKNTNCN